MRTDSNICILNKGKNRVPLRALARVACVAIGVQFGWALQLSLLTPYVQELGISHTFASYIWLCGPISGILVQPIVGYYSDNWPGSWGRRRPFIVIGAMLVVVAVVLIGFAADIGYMLGDSSSTRVRAITIFVIGFWILDLANNTLQGPCRALLADFTGKDQRRTRRANAFFSLFMAFGNVLGFAAGSFDSWPKIFPFTLTKACNLACANLKSAFLVDVILLLLTTFLSVTAAQEIPWSAMSQNPQLFTSVPTTPLLQETPVIIANENGKMFSNSDASTSSCTHESENQADSEELEIVQETFFWDLLSTFRDLPRAMWYILLVTALTWFAWFPFILFDTDWMGREVYRGEPNSESIEKEVLYHAGVRMGAFGLMLNAVVLGVSSLLIEPVCRRVQTRYVWGLANLLMTFCFASTAIITIAAGKASPLGYVQPPTSIKVAALATFAVLGAPLAVTYSVPYALTASFTSSAGGGQGLSMGVLNLAVALPQVIVSVGSGPWDALFGGGNIPSFLLAALAALIGGIMAISILPKMPCERAIQSTGFHCTYTSPVP